MTRYIVFPINGSSFSQVVAGDGVNQAAIDAAVGNRGRGAKNLVNKGLPEQFAFFRRGQEHGHRTVAIAGGFDGVAVDEHLAIGANRRAIGARGKFFVGPHKRAGVQADAVPAAAPGGPEDGGVVGYQSG